MNFKPLGKRILVERTEEVTKTASGIIIPDSAKEKPQMGKVVAMAKKVEERGEIKAGNTVLFGKYAGTEITVDGKEYLVMSIDDILGVM
ncbi:MAG TPA: co-chaperone GroES [Campylobacterales bacterium]|nr:co-chaperone GroES [Campylobacterales bacterium]